ncbi:MAG: hypothetical protein HY054_09675 [Proteobacteria bacterium]|nr:hypothetical protein [Pseudomonadota bacterium]
MRFFLLLAALAFAAPASADAPDARASYVERRGMLELDARCHLFNANIRGALEATAMQARGALLRGGWSIAQVQDLERTVIAAARTRSCLDPRTTTGAASARAASATWINANAQTFPGWTRVWYARRAPDAAGWRLSQAINAPCAASFGVRITNGREQLTLSVANASLNSATLVMRDALRTPPSDIALTQRVAYGLRAGAPSPATSTQFSSLSARAERGLNNAQQTTFTFPDTAFRNLLSLDPRETVEIHLAGSQQILLVDVGDVAVARAFLTIQ